MALRTVIPGPHYIPSAALRVTQTHSPPTAMADSDSDESETEAQSLLHSHHPLLPCLPECPLYHSTKKAEEEALGNDVDEWDEVGAQEINAATLAAKSAEQLNVMLCKLMVEEKLALQEAKRAAAIERTALTRVMATRCKDELDDVMAQRQAAVQEQWRRYRMGLISLTTVEYSWSEANPSLLTRLPLQFTPPPWIVPVSIDAVATNQQPPAVVKKRYRMKDFAKSWTGRRADKVVTQTQPRRCQSTDKDVRY